MKKVLLFGGTGNLGKEIAAELKRQNFETTAVIRNRAKAESIEHLTTNRLIADVTNAEEIAEICQGFEIVISSLGKSVSPNDRSKTTFREIDFAANSNVLRSAVNAGVKKFVYVSAFGSENYPQLEYFRVHHDFSEKLMNSGLNFSIIKPPAIFSSFLDLVEMAKKGRLVNLGSGENLTNPIYEGDLAKICVDSIGQPNAVIEAGGKQILSRKQINQTIQQTAAPHKKVRSVPVGLLKLVLPLMKIFDKNSFDKFAFFLAVSQKDTVAPQIGETRLDDYLKTKF